MSMVFLNFASLSNLRKPVFVSWHAQHVNAATVRYKDMSSSWGKTKEAATGDLSLWKHAMRPHPIFRPCSSTGKVLPWNSDLKKTQGKHLEGCELNKSFIIILKTHEQPRNQEHVTWKWLGSMNHWPQKASCPEEKVDTFAFSRCYRRYQELLEIPGSEVSENCLASFVADNPTHLASAFYTVWVCWRESQQGTAQEVARRYATWILRRVYHGLSLDFCQALGFQTCTPVRPVLRLLFWRPKMGNIVGWGVQAQMSCGKPLWL